MTGYASDLLLNLTLMVNLALALTVPYRWGGRLLLCQGVFVAIGAYTVPLLHAAFGLPVVGGIAAGGLIGALAGYIFAVFIRPMDPSRFALVTFLTGLAGMEVVANWGGMSGGRTGLASVPLLGLASVPPKLPTSVAMAIAAVTAILLSGRILDSQFGCTLRAVRDDEEGALLDGVSPSATVTQALVWTCAWSALTGAIWQCGLPRVLPDYFGFWSLCLPVILACILGGGERPRHILLGALLVFGLDELAQWLPVPVDLRADVPLLIVGLTYVVVMVAGGPAGVLILVKRPVRGVQ